MSQEIPSPMERRFLDLMDRMEAAKVQETAALEERIARLEAQDRQQQQQIAVLQKGQNALCDSLERFLAPRDRRPGSLN